jgi:hypothetical protein
MLQAVNRNSCNRTPSAHGGINNQAAHEPKSPVQRTSAAMQLWPAFCASPEATLVAWYSMSAWLQGPGTMM